MNIKNKLDKISFIAKTISPYNYYSLGYLDIFYLAYYKEYSYYSLERIRDYWLSYLKKNNPVYLNFYIHIPFCEVGCKYCKYFKDTHPTPEKIDKFLDYLENYFQYFVDVFKDLRIVNLHIGGGTPSLLSLKQLNRLFGMINKYCQFETPNEIAFEINPKSINLDKLKLLKKYKVNRLAIGIQSLQPEVLKAVDRNYYDFNYIKEMMTNIKKLGFEGTTLDILFGLYKDTPLSFMDTLKKTLFLRPDRIHIYVVNPPREYLSKYFNNDYNYFFKRINKLQKIVFPMIKQLLQNQTIFRCEDLSFKKKDYDITKIDRSKKKKNSNRKFGYSDTVEDNVAMLGIGKNSRSHLNEVIIYKDNNTKFLEFDSQSELLYGHNFDQEDMVLKLFFEQLINKENVDLAKIKRIYNVDFCQQYWQIIEFLLNIGMIEIKDNKLIPKFNNSLERFSYSLLFFKDEIIDNIYKNCFEETYE
jgi:oxygen-independent coproporphyrinogen-3 oxidase